MHTSYLSFLLHWQDFRKPNFTPKTTTKGIKNTKNISENVKYMHFFHSIWKNLHLTENFYTGTAFGACDKYEEWNLVTALEPGRLVVSSSPFFPSGAEARVSSDCVGRTQPDAREGHWNKTYLLISVCTHYQDDSDWFCKTKLRTIHILSIFLLVWSGVLFPFSLWLAQVGNLKE